jgi:hypothetical protein
MLSTVAVLGSPFTVTEIEAVLSRPASEFAAELRTAIAAGAVVEDGASLTFRHELIREALYEDVPQVLRRAQHREVARLLAGTGAPSDRVTAHWMLGADPGDKQAVDWLRRAARDAAAHSPAVAVDLLQRARELCAEDATAHAEIMAELVQPLASAGQRDELEALCRRALDGEGRPEDEMTFRAGLAHSLFIEGRRRAGPGLVVVGPHAGRIRHCGRRVYHAADVHLGQFRRQRKRRSDGHHHRARVHPACRYLHRD